MQNHCSTAHPRPAETAFADISDTEAIDDVRRGNREMFEVLVRRYNAQLYRVGMAYLRNHTLAEDAMQNAYVKAFMHLARFAGASSFSTWLTRIMINECLMLLRQQKSRGTEPLETSTAAAAEREATTETTLDTLHWKEMKALLEQAIHELPRNYRAVYILREVQQLTTEETAKCLGVSTDVVKVTLHRARERLKASLLRSAAATEVFSYTAEYCQPMTERVLRLILQPA